MIYMQTCLYFFSKQNFYLPTIALISSQFEAKNWNEFYFIDWENFLIYLFSNKIFVKVASI